MSRWLMFLTAVGVRAVAVGLGILFEKMNVNFLVGWAFSVAASANLPALVMLLFWKGTTRQGIIASVLVGMIASLAWILLSADTYKNVYKLPDKVIAPVPFSQPGGRHDSAELPRVGGGELAHEEKGVIPAAVVDLKSLGDMARSAAEAIVSIFKGEWPTEKVVNGEVWARFPSPLGERG